MQRNLGFFATLAFLLCAAPHLCAQDQSQQKTPEPAPERLRVGQAGSQQELDAYNKMHNEFDPAVKKNLIDMFAVDYPQSGLLAYVYQDGVYLGRQANNIEMMAEYGEKSLELWSDNFTLLTELGSVYVQRDRVEQAELKAQKALDLLDKTDKSPVYVREQQWTEVRRILLSSNYNTLGFVHLRHAQASQEPAYRKTEGEEARTWFVRAQQQQPNDDFTFYGLGFAHMILNDYPNAEGNLAKAVVLNGIVMASARTLLEEIYKSQHNQSLSGIEQVLLKAKADLGL